MIGFSSYTMFRDAIRTHGLEFAAQQTAALGFDSVEFLDILQSARPILPLLGNPERVSRILKEHQLSVACYTVAAQLRTDDPASIEEQMLRHIDFATAIGAPMVHHTLVPDLSLSLNAPTYDEVLERIFPLAERIAVACEQRGITCLYEPQGMYFNGIGGLGPFLERMQSNGHRVGICGDLGNSVFVDEAPETVLAHFANDIRHVHIKDLLVTDDPTDVKEQKAFRSRGGKWLCEVEPGRGSVHLAQCLTILKQINYQGKISFEFTADDKTVKRILHSVEDFFKAV